MVKASRRPSNFLLILLVLFMAALLFLRGRADSGLGDEAAQVSEATVAPKFTAVPSEPEAIPGTDDRQALLAQVQAEGRISIIVGFAAPYAPQRDAASDAAQQVVIDGVRNALVASIAAAGNTQVISQSQSWAIPFVALEVDEAAYLALLASPTVTSITENGRNDPFLPNTIPIIGANQIWALGETGAGQTVAIIDTGVAATHAAFGGRVVAEACFSGSSGSTTLCPNVLPTQTGAGAASPARCDSLLTGDDGCYHGTHVASIAAGSDPSRNIYGVARGANIIGVQVFSKIGSDIGAYDSDIVAGLNYVYSQRFTYAIASVNLSLGGGLFTTTCDSEEPATTASFALLRAAGIMPVVASGNDGSTTSISHPSCISTAVSVGATTDFDVRASFSNSRPSILSLFAPGFDIYAAMPPGAAPNDGTGYGTISGTSMAAPHVAGAFALMRDAVPSATVEQILTAMRNTGVPITVPGGTTPRINLILAYNQLMGITQPTVTPTFPPAPVPANDQSTGAYVISALPYTTFQSDIYYATTTGDPTAFCPTPYVQNVSVTGGSVVWYRYTQGSGSTVQVQIDTVGTSYDTILSVFTNPAGSSVVCNDDIDYLNGNYKSRLTLNAASGTTYYIAIAYWGGRAENPSTLQLNLRTLGSPTQTPAANGSITGSFLLQGRAAPPNATYAVPVHVIVKSIYGGAALFDGTVTTDTSSHFTVNNIPTGTYNVWVKTEHALARVGVVGVEGNEGRYLGMLLEGDADNNNLVALTDFSILASTFGKASSDAGYDGRADFNGDGIITITDFSLLANNFGLAGAAVP